MWRKLIRVGLDPVLHRIARRMEWLRAADRVRAAAANAQVDPTATLHPTVEIVNLRRERSEIVVGAHTHVRGQLLTFWDGGRIRIGDWSYIGEGTRIWSQSEVVIGDYVLIAHNVDIHDTDGHPHDWNQRRLDTESILSGHGNRSTERSTAPVRIEDDVWIGFKASILKGVRVGRGAIVAAGAVVTREVEPWTVVAGNPAQVIRVHGPSESLLV